MERGASQLPQSLIGSTHLVNGLLTFLSALTTFLEWSNKVLIVESLHNHEAIWAMHVGACMISDQMIA